MTQARTITVYSPETGAEKHGFSVSTELLDYAEAGRVFGSNHLDRLGKLGRFQPRAYAVPDPRYGNGAPIVFSVGSDDRLRVLRRGDAGTGGWDLIDLFEDAAAQGEAGSPTVSAFAVAWRKGDDGIAINLIVALNQPNGGSRLMMAEGLSARETDWRRVAWRDAGTREAMAGDPNWGSASGPIKITGIRIVQDYRELAWVAVMSGQVGDVDTSQTGRVMIATSHERRNTFETALYFEAHPPASEIYDFEVGVVEPRTDNRKDDEVSVLCLSAGKGTGVSVLKARPFPNFDDNGEIGAATPIADLPVPPDTRVLTLGSPVHTGDGLGRQHVYTGKAGVTRLPARTLGYADDRDLETVIPGTIAKDVRALTVTDHGEAGATVWAVTDADQLVVAWDEPRPAEDGAAPEKTLLRLRNGVDSIVAVPADGRALSASVLVFYRDGSAGHLWRTTGDAATWHEEPIRVNALDSAVVTPCFCTTITVRKGRMPVPFYPVRLTASALASVIVNDQPAVIGPTTALQTQADAAGKLVIFTRANTLVPASYGLRFDDHDHDLLVEPGMHIMKRLRTLKAADLKKANIGDGSDEAFASVIGSVNRVAQLAANDDGVLFVKPETIFANRLNTKLDDTASPPEATTLGDDIVALGRSFSDLIVSIFADDRSISDIFFKLVENTVKVVVRIGETVKEFIVHAVEEFTAVLTNIWKGIKAGFNKIVDFLKFLFDPKSIQRTKNIVVNFVETELVALDKVIGLVENRIDKCLDEARDGLEEYISSKTGGKFKATKYGSKNHSLEEKSKKQSEKFNSDVKDSSVFSTITEYLNKAVSNLITIELPETPALSEDESRDISSINYGERVSAIWDSVKADLQQFFDNPGKIANLDFDAIGDLIYTLLGRAGEFVLESARALAKLVLRLARGIVLAVRQVLFATIRFPIIEALLALIGFDGVDTSFRLIDALAYLLAIPATIAFKLFTGRDVPVGIEKFGSSDRLITAQSEGAHSTQLKVFREIIAWTGLVASTLLAAFSVITSLFKKLSTTVTSRIAGGVKCFMSIISMGQLMSFFFLLIQLRNPKSAIIGIVPSALIAIGSIVRLFGFICGGIAPFRAEKEQQDMGKELGCKIVIVGTVFNGIGYALYEFSSGSIKWLKLIKMSCHHAMVVCGNLIALVSEGEPQVIVAALAGAFLAVEIALWAAI